MHGASKGLYETLIEVYEPEWVGHELLYAQAQNSDMLWTDFCHKLQDQTLTPLTAYQQQFPELRVSDKPFKYFLTILLHVQDLYVLYSVARLAELDILNSLSGGFVGALHSLKIELVCYFHISVSPTDLCTLFTSFTHHIFFL